MQRRLFHMVEPLRYKMRSSYLSTILGQDMILNSPALLHTNPRRLDRICHLQRKEEIVYGRYVLIASKRQGMDKPDEKEGQERR